MMSMFTCASKFLSIKMTENVWIPKALCCTKLEQMLSTKNQNKINKLSINHENDEYTCSSKNVNLTMMKNVWVYKARCKAKLEQELGPQIQVKIVKCPQTTEIMISILVQVNLLTPIWCRMFRLYAGHS
jgi:hypothetical protein